MMKNAKIKCQLFANLLEITNLKKLCKFEVGYKPFYHFNLFSFCWFDVFFSHSFWQI